MVAPTLVQPTFAAGEIDPKLHDRSDLAAYYSSVAKARNIFFMPQGGFRRRPGLKFISQIGNLGTNSRLIPFYFSVDQKYIIVLNDGFFKIFQDDVFIASVATTITDQQVTEVKFAQSLDTLLIFHPDFQTKSLTRVGSTWTVGTWPYVRIPPAPSTRIYPEVNLTIDVNGELAKTNLDYWTAGDVGKYVMSPDGGMARIISIVTVRNAAVEFLHDFATAAYLSGDWFLESPVWSATAGWPICGEFAYGRLWIAGSKSYPNSIWASRVGDEYDFNIAEPDLADYGIAMTRAGSSISKFHSIHVGKHINFLSDNGIYFIPISNSEPPTPLNVSLVKNATWGAHKIPGTFDVDGNMFYIRTGGKSLISSSYNFTKGGYENTDLSLLTSHLMANPIDMAYRKQTNADESDYVFVVDGDGNLLVLCTMETQQVNAWSLCQTEGQFKRISTLDSNIYCIVDRNSHGLSGKFLEKFDDDRMLDCSERRDSGGPFTTLTNLGRFDTQYVKVVLDNTIHPDELVMLGQIAFTEYPSYVAEAGLAFPVVDEDTEAIVYLKTLPVILPASIGVNSTKKKRIVDITASIYKTSQILVYKNSVPIRMFGINELGHPLPMVTDLVRSGTLLGWDDVITIEVVQTVSVPLTVLALYYKVQS